MTIRRTTNYKLPLPESGKTPWHLYYEELAKSVDSLMARVIPITSYRGVWQNSTAYADGERALDTATGLIYEVEVSHTSSSSPTTFTQHRAANPTHWSLYTNTNTSVPVSSFMQPIVAAASEQEFAYLMQMQGLTQNVVSSNLTLGDEHVGTVLSFRSTGSTTVIITVPSISNFAAGASFIIRNVGSTPVRINGSFPGDFTQWLYGGQSIQIVKDSVSTSAWALHKWPNRVKLAQNTTINVNAAAGSDSNHGFDSAAPLLTLSEALWRIQNDFDFNGYRFTVSLNGTNSYSAINFGNTSGQSYTNWTGGGELYLVGSSGTTTIQGVSVYGPLSGKLTLASVLITGGLLVERGQIHLSSVEFSTNATAGHMKADYGGQINGDGGITISASCARAIYTQRGARVILLGQTLLSGTPAFSTATIDASGLSYVYAPTWSGSATGTRYTIVENSVVDANGATIPGNVAGSTATGGQIT